MPKGHTAAYPSSSPGDSITSTNTADPTGPTRVSTKSVDNLLSLATANIASRQQLEPTKNAFRFDQDRDTARL
jgi:hypothetical protein